MGSIPKNILNADAPLATYMRNIKSNNFNVAESAAREVDNYVAKQVILNEQKSEQDASYALRVNESIDTFISGSYAITKSKQKGAYIDTYV